MSHPVGSAERSASSETGTKEVKSSEEMPPKVKSSEEMPPKVKSSEETPPKVKSTERTSSEVKSAESLTPEVKSAEMMASGVKSSKSGEVAAQEVSGNIKLSESSKRIVMWTMAGFCDCNLFYLIRVRGIMNIIHMGLSIAVIVLLGTSCQLRPYVNGPSEGFFCKPPDAFFFITACCSFITSFLYLFCCLLSKRTEALLFDTSFEVSYFVLYFILFLTGSIALLISILNGQQQRIMHNVDYHILQSACIVGLVNSLCYGVSAIWFFITHRYYDKDKAVVDVA